MPFCFLSLVGFYQSQHRRRSCSYKFKYFIMEWHYLRTYNIRLGHNVRVYDININGGKKAADEGISVWIPLSVPPAFQINNHLSRGRKSSLQKEGIDCSPHKQWNESKVFPEPSFLCGNANHGWHRGVGTTGIYRMTAVPPVWGGRQAVCIINANQLTWNKPGEHYWGEAWPRQYRGL